MNKNKEMKKIIKLEDVLIKLGFQKQESGYVYDFGNCELKAIPSTTRFLVECITFLGLTNAGAFSQLIDFDLPDTVDSQEQGEALIAYNLRDVNLKIKPDWLDAHIKYNNLLPWNMTK
jgi:hypothetical protein